MIYIDVSAAVHSRAGLGRYSHQLAQAVAELLPGKVALFYNRGRHGRRPNTLAELPARSVLPGYKPWRMAVWLAHLARLPYNRLVPDAKLFHSTEHLLMPLRDVPTVLTVHDLIFKLFPAYHKRLNYWFLNWTMPLFCRRATAIITVSEATKRDIVAHYAIEPTKIHVIPEAPSDSFKPPDPSMVHQVRSTYQLPEKYLIHLGTIEPRKNLSRLVDAFQILRSDHPNLNLLLVGAKGWLYDDLIARIRGDGLDDIVHLLGRVDDEDLPAIIGGALLAVQPSLYEGFGLPVLEHMACGQVVAASDRGSLPEVGGKAAVYFDPLDPAQMAGVIGQLLRDEDQYQRRRQMGLRQAKQYSWERTARSSIAIYESLL